MDKLSNDEIEAKLADLNGWSVNTDQKLEKNYQCKDFKDALGFVVRIGLAAEAMDHHPELFNVYNKVKIELTTHDAGGISQKDFDLAKQIDALA
jgi:4a-hydroxytetrahydrobiopterin dehydratase